MKNGNSNFEFSYTYIKYLWQILKHFTGTFRRAQSLKLGGVNVGQEILLSKKCCVKWDFWG